MSSKSVFYTYTYYIGQLKGTGENDIIEYMKNNLNLQSKYNWGRYYFREDDETLEKNIRRIVSEIIMDDQVMGRSRSLLENVDHEKEESEFDVTYLIALKLKKLTVFKHKFKIRVSAPDPLEVSEVEYGNSV